MNKKIDIPLLKQRILWTAVMLSITLLLVLSINKKVNNKVGNININIANLEGNRNLIKESDVLNVLKSFIGVKDLSYVRIKKIDISELEELLQNDKRLKSVEIYVDGKGKLNIDIEQKQPIVRMMDGSTKGYYLDKEGNRIPLVNHSAVRVPIATGNFELYEDGIFKRNKPMKIKEVFTISQKIHKDPFMKSLIEQITVDDIGDIVLVPKIGRQYVVIGDTNFIDEKFDNLKIMYQEGMPREGWRKYTSLVLKYRGQVVAKTSETIPVVKDSTTVVDASKILNVNNKEIVRSESQKNLSTRIKR
jgi:cell division protein FtsQ